MSSLSLAEAQGQFSKIMRNVDKHSVSEFCAWIQANWLNGEGLADTTKNKTEDSAEVLLNTIATDLRSSLPLEAVLPSENICHPSFGKNADCVPKFTVHVDEFLYDDELVDTLCEEGQLSRYYCTQCGSHNTRPLTFISHSASRERMKFIFKCMLPPLDGKTILDIGSRLGAVLYGAYVFTSASKIIGVEMNTELCALQNQMVSKYRLKDRVQVIEADIMKCPDIVIAADVIIMNNVFEFFLSDEEQANVWSFLRHTIKKGTMLVTIPTLEESHTRINLLEWIEEMPMYNLDAIEATLSEDEALEIGLYKVK